MKILPLQELLHSIFAAFLVFVPESRDDTCCNCFNNACRITAFEIIKSTILCRVRARKRERKGEREGRKNGGGGKREKNRSTGRKETRISSARKIHKGIYFHIFN